MNDCATGVGKGASEKQPVTNRELFFPYLFPYFAYVAMDFFFGDRLSVEFIYALRLVVVTGLLIWAWRWYPTLRGPKSATGSVLWGLAAGIAGCAGWILLLWPFVDPTGGPPWSRSGFVLRMLAASLVVPIFEELFIRGYIFRVALQWDQARQCKEERPLVAALDHRCMLQVEPGAWSIWAVIVSTVAFALGHLMIEWPAALFYGLLMVGLWIARKDLLSCVVAHGVTNFTLALYVNLTGHWGFW